MLGEISNGGAVMKTISIFLALINLLFAGFLIALDLSYNEIHLHTLWWSLLKLSTAAAIIVIGIIVWLEVTGAIRPTLVLLGSVFLIALGPSTIVWAVHVALTTGNVEVHMAVYGGSLMAQGMASLLGFAEETRKLTVS
jgi:hypothetical protein